MVNIHISQENKALFKSKNAVNKFKKFLKETEDTGLISDIEYLKEGYHFDFKQEGEDIYVNTKAEDHVWGKQLAEQQKSQSLLGKPVQQPQTGREKIRKRLEELRAKRSGRPMREINSMKKSVDKNIFQKYLWIQQNVGGLPLPKPTEILEDPMKYKEQIELFGSGFMKISGNQKIDQTICEYFKLLGDKVGITPLNPQQIQEKIKASQPQAPQAPQAPPENFDLPSNINLSNYVDSDTESESSDDEEEEQTKEEENKQMLEEDNKQMLEEETKNSDIDV
tara:strand:- start:129 stop:968 length:840 start_codon:yes stop_codon:yes gene_type:complete